MDDARQFAQGHPLLQVQEWLDWARAAGVNQPAAMCITTGGSDGQPSARMVLLRGLDARGAVFYTNSRSRKRRSWTRTRTPPVVLH